MEQTIYYNKKIETILLTLFGCVLITASHFIKIPFYPVAFTIHTFAVLLIGLILPPKLAGTSALCYLFISLPFWMMSKSIGYFIAFPLASYYISKMKNKQSPIVACLIATCLILFFGYIGLLSFMNWKAALIYGVIVFIPSDILKMFIAVKLAKRIHP